MHAPRVALRAVPLLLALGVQAGVAAPPAMLRDINDYPRREDVDTAFIDPVATGGKLFFRLTRPETGSELGVVDGSTGALQHLDLEPGPIGAIGFAFVRFGTKVLFPAAAGGHGNEPWVSDGTPGGTFELKDIDMGQGSSSPSDIVDLDTGAAVFTAFDFTNGREVWQTDGTAEGTMLAFDLVMGMTGSFPGEYAAIPGALLFSAFDATGGEPWLVTIGFLGPFADIAAGGSSFPREFTFLPSISRVVFSAAATSNNREPWVTDGTAMGTTLLGELEPGAAGSNPFDFVLVGDRVLFRARTTAHGAEHWRTNGTSAGTAILPELHTGAHDSIDVSLSGALIGTSSLVFAALTPDGGREPAVTDGTTVTRLADVMPGPGSSWINENFRLQSRVVSTPTKAYVGLDDGAKGWELWQTDGTSGGTSLLADLLPGPRSSQALPVASENETTYVLAYGPDGYGLWRLTGGTPTLLTDLTLPGTDDAQIFEAVAAGSRVFFSAFDGEAGQELWTTDGSVGGTGRVGDLVPGFGGLRPQSMAALGNRVFFNGIDQTHGFELFVSDGTAGGTQLVADIVPGDGNSFPQFLVALGEKILFHADTPDAGRELWISDGTPAGTTLVKDIRTGPADGLLGEEGEIVVAGQHAFFNAFGPDQALWRSDGTSDGTVPLAEASASSFVPFGDRVLFAGSRTLEGNELWISDGTPIGTHPVVDLHLGSDGSSPRLITVAGSRAFFVAGSPPANRELWVTDGTAPGTTPLTELVPGDMGALFREMAALGDGVVFTADTGTGDELWASDGTAAGTQKLTGLCPSGHDCAPQSLFGFDGLVFFQFDDGAHGSELWRTDGTSAGTNLVADSVPGAASFTFDTATIAFLGGKIFLVGCEEAHGCEPWLYDHDQCPADPAKLEPGDCGCGVPDVDADASGVSDCIEAPDECPADSTKRAPGDCGCGVPDVDTDASGVSDCLIAAELRQRIDALITLIEPLARPRSKAERQALRAQRRSIRTALAAMLAYHEAHTTFPGLAKPLRKARKAVRRVARPGPVTGPRGKALTALTALRDAIV